MALRRPLILVAGVLVEMPVTDQLSISNLNIQGVVSAPSSGAGFEINGGSAPLIKAYDRTGSAYIPMGFDSTYQAFNANGTLVATISSTGIAIVGIITGTAGFDVAKAAASGRIQIPNEGGDTYNVIGSRNAANSAYLPLVIRSATYIALDTPLRLANAYVATPPTCSGYLTVQDSGGTTYKLLVST